MRLIENIAYPILNIAIVRLSKGQIFTAIRVCMFLSYI